MKTILFSGVFKGYSRTQLESMAEGNGFKLLSGVTGNLNYLVAGEKMGPEKHKKADALGVPIITLKAFLAMLKKAGKEKPANVVASKTKTVLVNNKKRGTSDMQELADCFVSLKNALESNKQIEGWGPL